VKKIILTIIFLSLYTGCAIKNDVLVAPNEHVKEILPTPNAAAETTLTTPNISVKVKSPTPNTSKRVALDVDDFEGHYKGTTYKFIFEDITWHEANDRAIAMGATLACVDTEAKLSYLQSLKAIHDNMDPVWIGLSNNQNDGQWQWVCGNDLNPEMTYKLNKGRNLQYRNYGHLMQRKGFLSRSNEGVIPTFMRRALPIKGYVVEFKESEKKIINRKVDDIYKQNSPVLFTQLIEAREVLDKWGGAQEILDSAEKIIKEILDKDDSFAPAYKEMASVLIKDSMVHSNYHHRHQLALAEGLLHKAISIEPSYADAYVMLAEALIKMKHYDEAKSALLNAVQKGADEELLHLQWGYLQKKTRRYSQASMHYNVVLNSADKTTKNYRVALAGITSINKVTNKLEQALAGHEELITLSPSRAWRWGNYASFLLYTYNDVDGAIEKSRKALSIMDYGIARGTLASALYTKWARLNGDVEAQEEANQYFAEAYTLEPNVKGVISKLIRYKHTKITATSLQRWLIENGNEEREEKNEI